MLTAPGDNADPGGARSGAPRLPEAGARADADRQPPRCASASMAGWIWDILEAYREHGFYIFEGVVGADEVAELRPRCDEMLERAPVRRDAQGRRAGPAGARARTTRGKPYLFVKPLADPWGGTDVLGGRHPLQDEPAGARRPARPATSSTDVRHVPGDAGRPAPLRPPDSCSPSPPRSTAPTSCPSTTRSSSSSRASAARSPGTRTVSPTGIAGLGPGHPRLQLPGPAVSRAPPPTACGSCPARTGRAASTSRPGSRQRRQRPDSRRGAAGLRGRRRHHRQPPDPARFLRQHLARPAHLDHLRLPPPPVGAGREAALSRPRTPTDIRYDEQRIFEPLGGHRRSPSTPATSTLPTSAASATSPSPASRTSSGSTSGPSNGYQGLLHEGPVDSGAAQVSRPCDTLYQESTAAAAPGPRPTTLPPSNCCSPALDDSMLTRTRSRRKYRRGIPRFALLSTAGDGA